MKSQKRPCNECPFRKESLSGWLGGFESPQELYKLALAEIPFSCHQPENLSDMEDRSKLQCAGRLAFAVKACKSFRDPELEMLRMNVKSSTDLNSILGINEFVEHHSNKIS
jgi:hypothetical protein